MRGRQVILLTFAVIAIGLFVLPNTMSMFVGQHRWYSVRTASGQYAMCERCHFAEVGEWQANTGAHAAYRAYYPTDPGCFCHQINETRLQSWINTSGIADYGYEFFNETGTVNGSNPATFKAGWRNTTTPHAATTIFCVDCHLNATAQLTNTNEAHKAFFVQASNDTLNPAATNNTPCMACHTMVGLNVTMSRLHGGLIINATHGADYNWTVNVTFNTTRTTNSSYWPPNSTNQTP
jgi:hypothetical protein